MKQLSVAVLGASGYSGGELLRILQRHSYAKLDKVFAQSSAGALVSDVHPWYAEADRTFEAFDSPESIDSEIVFLALPHGEAMQVAPKLLDAGKIVIDLSGDHRLKDTQLFSKYYGRPQTSGSALDEAVYGLPEWTSEAVRSARFIANPGCYATSAILGLAPLLKESLIESRGIVISSMSGVSGAGKKAAVDYSFTEVNETVKAYKVGDHQHIPEIETVLGGISNEQVKVTFIPHLIPITRGIYTTTVAQLCEGANASAVIGAFTKHYEDKPFVRFHAERIPEIKRVLHSNFIDIGVRVLAEANQVVVLSTIDNLIKGAAGQAVQNMNIACGFPEKEGLL